MEISSKRINRTKDDSGFSRRLYHAFHSNILSLARILSLMVVVAGLNAVVFWHDGSLDEKNAVRATLLAEEGIEGVLSSIGSGDSTRGALTPERGMERGNEARRFVRTVSIRTDDSVKVVEVSVRWHNLLTSNVVKLTRPIGKASEKLVKLEEGSEGVTRPGEPLGGSLLPVDDGEDSDDLATLGAHGVGGPKK